MTDSKELLLGEPERVFRRDESPVLRLNEEEANALVGDPEAFDDCLLYTSPSPRDPKTSRMPSSA